MKPLDSLAMAQIERRLKPLRKHSATTHIRTGWIQYIRKALGMSLKDLAVRTRGTVSTVAQAEKREAQGKVTVETLRKMATAMDCELIYAFIPKTEIRTILRQKAQEKAKRILSRTNTHMSLEDQEVQQSMKTRIERLTEKLIKDGDIW